MTRFQKEKIDGMLLLLARGASTAEVGQVFGLTGDTIQRRLGREVPEAYRDALAARPVVAGKHGTGNRYNRGCRCPECADATRERMAKRRHSRKPPVHGTKSAYRNHGCRCDPCKAAGSVENAQNREKLTAGEWQNSHGSWLRWLDGCRCVCCEATHQYRNVQAINRNNETLDHAHHHYQPWSGPELETALAVDDGDQWLRPAREVAEMIGRTLCAVEGQRSLARKKNPKTVMFL